MRNRLVWLIVAALILPSTIWPNAGSPLPALNLNVGQLVAPMVHPQPPDYLSIRKQSDERIETARLEALRAEEKTQAQNPPQPTVSVAPVASGEVYAAIVKWAGVYGVSADWLLRVAYCESGLRVNASNPSYYAGGGHPSGVFQFLPQTFYANAARVGIPDPYLWNYDQQAQTAAWMFSIGQSGQWACK